MDLWRLASDGPLFTPVLIDAETGALTGARSLPWYLKVLEISRPLHFGDYGGLPLKILWALLDVITIALLSSGLYLWFKKRDLSIEDELGDNEEAESGEAEQAKVSGTT